MLCINPKPSPRSFADVLYLDAVENKYIEEVSSCNMFVVKGKNIATPPLGGTILPGITRKSVIQIARDAGYTVEERPVSVDELCEGAPLDLDLGFFFFFLSFFFSGRRVQRGGAPRVGRRALRGCAPNTKP